MSFASDGLVKAILIGAGLVLASTVAGAYFGWRALTEGGFLNALLCLLFLLPTAFAAVVLWALLGGPTGRAKRSASPNREP